MKVGVLVTNDGVHTARDWAQASIKQLMSGFVIRPESERRVELETLKAELSDNAFRVLHGVYSKIQLGEAAALSEGAILPVDGPFDPSGYADVNEAAERIAAMIMNFLKAATTVDLISLLTGRELTGDAFGPLILDIVKSRVFCDARTIMQIERKNHADRRAVA
jgi:hypothetical protein